LGFLSFLRGPGGRTRPVLGPIPQRGAVAGRAGAREWQGTMALRTRVTELLEIAHPVILGGMGRGATVPPMVAAVSEAGGLGVLGVTRYPADRMVDQTAAVRAATSLPFGLNLLLFATDDAAVDAVLAERPPVFSTAWPWPEQDLRAIFDRAHAVGAKVMHMVATVEEARRASEAGADVIVAQGTEGGGHVGTVGGLVLVPMVARAVA